MNREPNVRQDAERIARGELAPHVSDLTRERFRQALERAAARDAAHEAAGRRREVRLAR